MLKIRRPLGRLIFNMGIAIPGKTVFLIETAPWVHIDGLVQERVNFSALAMELRLFSITLRYIVSQDIEATCEFVEFNEILWLSYILYMDAMLDNKID